MPKDLYIILGRDDDADAIFDFELNLIYTNDRMQNGELDLGLIAALGYNWFRIEHSKFISHEEWIPPDTSSEVANIDLLTKRLREYINGN